MEKKAGENPKWIEEYKAAQEAKNSSFVRGSESKLSKKAADENYAKEKIDALHNAVRMSKQINEEFGLEGTLESGQNSGIRMTRFGVAYHSDGSVTYFAELEKSLAKQKERLEESSEKRAEEKREADRKEDHPTSAKRVMAKASSPEELMERIRQIDWSESNTAPTPESGHRFDCRA